MIPYAFLTVLSCHLVVLVGWQARRLIFGLLVVGAGPPGHFEPPPCGVGGPGLLLRPVPPEGDGHSFLYCFQKGIWA